LPVKEKRILLEEADEYARKAIAYAQKEKGFLREGWALRAAALISLEWSKVSLNQN
jgi:hypothetical protein